MAKHPVNKNKKSASLRSEIENHKRTAYREGILQAARTVFCRLGFDEAKMVTIAEEAGVSVGTLYNYFKSKEEVIRSLTTHEIEELRSRIASVESIEDPLERIRKMVQVSCEFIDERGALMSMSIQAGLVRAYGAAQFLDPGHREIHEIMVKLYRDALTEAVSSGRIRTDMPISQLATMFIGMVTAMVFEWGSGDRKRSLSEQGESIFDLFMKGVLVR